LIFDPSVSTSAVAFAKPGNFCHFTGMSVLTTHRWTVEEYHRLASAGLFAPEARVELIDGVIYDMRPIGPFHAGVTAALNEFFAGLSNGRWLVWPQNPLKLDDHSEPVPDITLLKRIPDIYKKRHPTAEDVILIIEVADSTVSHDRGKKLPAYAKAGIPEFWLVNLSTRKLEVYRKPHYLGYDEHQVYAPGESVSPAAFPDAAVDVEALLRQTG
jgi:Uma2 family endonuclease